MTGGGACAPSAAVDGEADRAAGRPAFGEALRVWARIGCLSFGGPAGQIALMHREIVEQRAWLGERAYLNALNFCMLLPGPEAMQLATYVGWRLHGIPGGLAAGLLFVLPGALLVLGLALAYTAFGDMPLVGAAFVGIKAAVLVIVLEALLRISRRALHDHRHILIAAAAFIAIFFLAVPFPLIVAAAAVLGATLLSGGGAPAPADGTTRVSNTLTTVLVWLGIWLLPLAWLWAWLGSGHVLVELGVFFSKLAVVTFGGAYAVLAYMAQAAVESHGWLTAGEMLDGLGLAETTPGPLILVTEFVGYLAAARSTAESSIPLGLAGAAVTLWMTFAPCFLWIFAGAPYVFRIGQSPRLQAALEGITAAVVGVILNLSIWFGLNVLVPGIEERWLGPVRYWLPPSGGIDPLAATLAVVAALALFRLRLGVPSTLALAGSLALLWFALAG